MSEEKELSVVVHRIEHLECASYFTGSKNIDDILLDVEKKALRHVAYINTATDRANIKKNVTMVTKVKTLLESKGKDLSAHYKSIPKKIDENRKKTREFLEALQRKCREPLTLWEQEQEQEKIVELAQIKLKEKEDKQREADIKARREADNEHVKNVNCLISSKLIDFAGITEKQANSVIETILKFNSDLSRYIKINY